MQIDHLVLTRLDGSSDRQDDVSAIGDARQIGAAIELTLPGSEQIRAKVTRLNDETSKTRIGAVYATGQLTVYAVEIAP